MKTRALLPLLAVSLTTALALAGAGVASSARADGDGDRDRDNASRDTGYREHLYRHDENHDDDDHDRARRALQAGEVLPLADILAGLDRIAPGRVIETELEFDDGRYVYEFTLVSPDGRLMEAEVDAATGRLIELEDED